MEMGVYFYVAAVAAVVSFIGIILLLIYLISTNQDNRTIKYQVGGKEEDYISRQYSADNYNRPNGRYTQSETRTVEYQPTCDMSSATVIFISENGTKTQKELGAVMNIGRNTDNDFVVSDTRTSGLHCRMFNENGKLYIEDMSSRNGTFVNGVRIVQRTSINNGDTVAFGQAKYKVNF